MGGAGDLQGTREDRNKVYLTMEKQLNDVDNREGVKWTEVLVICLTDMMWMVAEKQGSKAMVLSGTCQIGSQVS